MICSCRNVSRAKVHSAKLANACIDTAWDKIPLTPEQKRAVWRTNNSQYLLRDDWSTLRKLLPAATESQDEVIEKNKALFVNLDLTFVKV